MSACPCACPAPAREMVGRIEYVASEPELMPQTALQPVTQRQLLASFLFKGEPLPELLKQIDNASGGKLKERIKEGRFHGSFGEKLVIALHEIVHSAKAGWYLVLVGAGERQYADKMVVCSAFGSFLTTAVQLGVSELDVLFSTQQIKEQRLDVEGMARLLRCRSDQQAAHYPECGIVKVEVLCDQSQAEKVERGLNMLGTLCHHCSLPVMNQTER